MTLTHRALADGRWHTLPLVEQLGHVGSEVSRASRWQSRNPDLARGALHRALELLDLTLADPRLRGSPARLREVARAREVVVDFFAGSNVYHSTSSSIQKYFDAYAMAARRAVGRSDSPPQDA
ncbi:MAG: hypothetical protein U0Q12_24990 [Vicinamibacterales bacterium]